MTNRTRICPYCGGTSLLRDDNGAFASCPQCGGAGYLSKKSTTESKIKWIDSEKAFDVQFVFPVGTSLARELLLKEFPHQIVQDSNCSCGHPLSLGDHDLQLESGNVRFRGYFYCSSCLNKNWLRRYFLRRELKACFDSIVKVKLGSKGLEIKRSNK